MPTYNIATFDISFVGTTFTTKGVTYSLTPDTQTSAPFTYYSVPDQTSIPAYSFNALDPGSSTWGIHLLTFICGDNVTSINNRAFLSCNLLTSIILSKKVTSIEIAALSSCSLTTITLPETLTSIAEYALSSNNALKTVYFRSKTFPTFTGQALTTKLAFSSFPIAYVVSPSLIGDFQNTNLFSNVYYLPPPCFKEGSKILTIDGYVPIEKLRKGDLIQTLKNNYLPIVFIGKSTIYNSGDKERIQDRLYTLYPHHYPDLTEDLILTGCHSILVDRFTSEQEYATLEKYGKFKITDGKSRLETYLDSRAEPYKKKGNFTIYHLALENDNYYSNYGIWANGLLVESCSKRYLNEISNMEIIN